MYPEPLARVVRSGLQESEHLGHVAVCDGDGRLIASAGDPDALVFARSCMKPLQAAVSLKAVGQAEKLPDRELAIMCASHNAEPVHVAVVRALLERAGLGPESLKNPPGWPLDEESMARAQHRNRELHNCSGKHAGMLLACVRSGWGTETYLRRSHPYQRRVLRAVQKATGVDDLAVGIDGCGVPVHGMPLRAMAMLFARLARSERMDDLAPQADRAVEAMLAEPYLVGGRSRADTSIMQVSRDVMAKTGAEALGCAAVLGSGLGVAVKVADGGWRAIPPALIATLGQVDALDAAQVAELEPFARPSVLGGGEPVGEIEPLVKLRPAR